MGNLKSQQIEAELETISKNIRVLAERCRDDSELLLVLLRILERLHREIREELFQTSLPDTRHSLYEFLKKIEETGGWPYIERMKLQDFLEQMQPSSPEQQRGE
ncbi:MAG: hypothetical protein ACFB4I_05135 [Cyanophyceae cyanobacterium]